MSLWRGWPTERGVTLFLLCYAAAGWLWWPIGVVGGILLGMQAGRWLNHCNDVSRWRKAMAAEYGPYVRPR